MDGAHRNSAGRLRLGLRVRSLAFFALVNDTDGSHCSYKNAQMVFSAVRHLPQYSTDSNSPGQAAAPVPPIRAWQETVEEAWRQGELSSPIFRSPFRAVGRPDQKLTSP